MLFLQLLLVFQGVCFGATWSTEEGSPNWNAGDEVEVITDGWLSVGSLRGLRLTLQEGIGDGGEGRVHRAEIIEGSQPTAFGHDKVLAIKLIRGTKGLDNGALSDVGYEIALKLRQGDQLVHRLRSDRVHPGAQYVGEQIGVANLRSLKNGETYFAVFSKYYDSVSLHDWRDAFELNPIHANNRHEAVLRIRRTLRVADQVLWALAYLHSHGIQFRDLKPSNILLTGTIEQFDRGEARAVLTDLGMIFDPVLTAIQRAFEGEGKKISIPGTSGFCAPEQLLAPGEIHFEADLWPLGVTLYKLLTGETPFETLFNSRFYNDKQLWQRGEYSSVLAPSSATLPVKDLPHLDLLMALNPQTLRALVEGSPNGLEHDAQYGWPSVNGKLTELNFHDHVLLEKVLKPLIKKLLTYSEERVEFFSKKNRFLSVKNGRVQSSELASYIDQDLRKGLAPAYIREISPRRVHRRTVVCEGSLLK
ncbi:MAG: protein kinase [Bdellovibrionota bacterium]